MSDDVMPESFEWPTQAEMEHDGAFRMWLIRALSRIHGQVTALEKRTGMVEQIIYWAAGIMGGAVLVALVRLVVK